MARLGYHTRGAPQTLIAFLRSAGGISDPGGDLKSMGFKPYQDVVRLNAKSGTATQFGRGLINPKGMDPDKAREAAAEAGYLGPCIEQALSETTVADLFDALERDEAYSILDQHEIEEKDCRRGKRKRKQELAEARENIGDYLAEHGGSRDDAELIAIAADFLLSDGDIEAAIDSACLALEGLSSEPDMKDLDLPDFDAAPAERETFCPEPEPLTYPAVDISTIVDSLVSDETMNRLLASITIDRILNSPNARGLRRAFQPAGYFRKTHEPVQLGIFEARQ